jgi:AbrB family looped-hinge helix DNA binding protein
MPTKRAKITSKGEITIPRETRRALGVRPGDHLLFEQNGSEVRIRAERTESPFEQFRGIGTPGISGSRRGIVRWVRKLGGR